MSDEPFATVEDIEDAWKTLSAKEKTRAEYWLKAASRKIRRRWKDIDARIAAELLNKGDVADVVVALVLDVLPSLENAGLRSMSVQAGSMGRSFTLEDRSNQDRLHLEDWMVEILNGSVISGAAPQIAAPRPYNFNRVFPDMREVYDS